MSYSFEVIEAGAQEVITNIEGYGEWRRTYLICMGLETRNGTSSYAGTIYNETNNRLVPMWNGSTRFLTEDEDKAVQWFERMLYPRTSV